MTEEVKVESKLEVPEGTEVSTDKVELSPIEQQALEMGWKPRENFSGSDDEFIDAKEFVRRKPLFDKLEQQGKQLKQVQRALHDFKTHYTTMREVEYQRAIDALKAQRDEAVEDADKSRFRALDKQIETFEQEAQKIREINVPAKHDPQELTSWMERNPWYQKDEAMTAFADRVGTKFAQAVDRGEMAPLEVLIKVEEAVKKEFEHKFKNPNKQNAPTVAQGKSTAPVSSKEYPMSEMERKIYNNLVVRQKLLTKEQYIADLKRSKGEA